MQAPAPPDERPARVRCPPSVATYAILLPHAALVYADVARAMANLALPNEHESQAVDARQEIDLRIGASFTRLQTLLLQNKFDWGEYAGDGGRLLLRWGCAAGGRSACKPSRPARDSAAQHGRDLLSPSNRRCTASTLSRSPAGTQLRPLPVPHAGAHRATLVGDPGPRPRAVLAHTGGAAAAEPRGLASQHSLSLGQSPSSWQPAALGLPGQLLSHCSSC